MESLDGQLKSIEGLRELKAELRTRKEVSLKSSLNTHSNYLIHKILLSQTIILSIAL